MKTYTFVLLVFAGSLPISWSWSFRKPKLPFLIPSPKYEPRRKIVDVKGIKTYEVGTDNQRLLLIGIHDVFGLNWNNNVKQIADNLADGGYRVSLPDFYNGNAWTAGKYS